MRIKTLFQLAFLAIVLIAIGLAIPASAEDPPGKKVFMDAKCNSCHSIESQGITKTMASAKGTDLSTIGTDRNAEWLTKYLMKEEAKEDKKHVKAWTGKKEDLDTLVKWLETLKKK